MFEPNRSEKQDHPTPWNALIACNVSRTLPTPTASRKVNSFIEIRAEANITITLPAGHVLLGTEDNTHAMTTGDWFQFVWLGNATWACRG